MGKSQTKWDDRHLVTVYQLAREGLPETQIAKALGVKPDTFRSWKMKRSALRDACRRGRKHNGTNGTNDTFRDYVYQKLPEHLKKLWHKINDCEIEEYGPQRLNALFAEGGKRARQHLFIYAYVASNFNTSVSMGKVGVSRSLFHKWCEQDADFAELIDELHWHKKNFFEAALIGRVAAGDTSAIIHVNRTINADRGYSEKVRVEVTGAVEHTMTALSLDDLDLPLATRKAILAAMRAKQNGDQNGNGKDQEEKPVTIAGRFRGPASGIDNP